MQLYLLYLPVALIGAFVISALCCGIALRLAPNFRSGEKKEGFFRADQSLAGNAGSTSAVGKKGRRVSSSELPLVGSRGMLPAMLIAGAATGWLMNFSDAQWILLGILGAGLVGFWLVGFIDDWKKVHSGNGIREITKLIGVVIVSTAVAIALLEFVDKSHTAYSPYIDIPVIGSIITHVRHAWAIFFIIVVVAVCSTTSLAVDFSDGLDGLAGGLTFPAALAYAIIMIIDNRPEYYPLIVAALVLAGSSLGFLPWNWPSAWKGKTSTARRRARMIMGDSGSLALGGLLAMIAVIDRQELQLIFIGGVFVIEGLSAVIQSRLLVKFYRRFLRVERFQANGLWFPHTEFPLPFLATPLHHHFDLLGWDRRRLVYGAWMIASLFALLAVVSVMAPVTWERYLARGITIMVLIALWQSGHHSRYYFVGTVASGQDHKLALFYGYPFRLFGRRMYSLVEQVEATTKQIFSPAEEGGLWVRMSVFDARAALGFYCYRAGFYALAREQWERIPQKNLAVRPSIQTLLNEARRRVAIGKPEDSNVSSGTIETAMGAEPSPADSYIGTAFKNELLRIEPFIDTAITGPLKTSDTMPAHNFTTINQPESNS